MRLLIAIANAVTLLGALSATQPVTASPVSSSQPSGVSIREPQRPKNTWRTYGGRCGDTSYRVSIWTGRPLSASVREMMVNNLLSTQAAQRALAKWPNHKGVPVDVVIDRCEAGRARIGFHLVEPNRTRGLRFFYLWLGANGTIEVVGER